MDVGKLEHKLEKIRVVLGLAAHRNDNGVNVVRLEIGVVDHGCLEALGRIAEMGNELCASADRHWRIPLLIKITVQSGGWRVSTPAPWNPNSFCGGLVEQMCETAQRQRIPLGSEPGDHAVGAKRDIGVMAEFLALVNVRDMDFDDGGFEGIERVKDRN